MTEGTTIKVEGAKLEEIKGFKQILESIRAESRRVEKEYEEKGRAAHEALWAKIYELFPEVKKGKGWSLDVNYEQAGTYFLRSQNSDCGNPDCPVHHGDDEAEGEGLGIPDVAKILERIFGQQK